MTSANAFDHHLEQWIMEQEKPWGVLKCKLTQANLAKHLGAGPLRILDAGGGNGSDSLPLAQQGHFVEIVDYSEQMLSDAVRRIRHANLQERVTVHQANVQDVDRLFPASHFDAVLCHNLLQYIEDVPALLNSLASLMKVGGLLSLISINRYSQAYHAAFIRGDLAEAFLQVDNHQQKSHLFDTVMTTYSVEEISDLLNGAGFQVDQSYGLRCLYDYWGDNDSKFDPAISEQLERLEFALMDRYPYKLLARYYHVMARKKRA
ncbi:MAG TPA: methyltransferase domain-containing protein [Anaerolineae bacterium]|nr:methyltransferase domain-containing protein [Anaerolineae bacterium]